MGFLDDLKRQADALRDQQSNDSAALQRSIAITEQACGAALVYIKALADQLEVLRPVSPARYVLDRQHSFTDLRMSDFYADARKKEVGGEPGFDYILLHWQLKSGQCSSS
ncbi:hypothetical protein [Ideonella sp. BN130291]|uniref:hypothetical protein n=1 Tax=Ideonella sp. BN130291 TaxID=3112940 RepID=UPI002E26EC90|nr:hypothetical protein [Ideonella sp. BN130291]